MNLQGFLQETIAKVIKRGQEGRTAVRFELDVDAEITVPREKAVTCALALTELLRNACRHAFPGRADGLVRISASVRPNRRLEITIADDGVGFARTGPEEASDGCGLHLVHGLARHQLRGEASVDSVPAGGTLVRLAFPLEEPNE
jgi:two-component sensor histidine kinase